MKCRFYPSKNLDYQRNGFSFTIFNTGDAPLIISGVELSGEIEECSLQVPVTIQPKDSVKESSGTEWLSQISANEVEVALELYNAKRKIDNKRNKFIDNASDKAGEVGQSVGEFAGRLRSNYDFDQKVKTRVIFASGSSLDSLLIKDIS